MSGRFSKFLVLDLGAGEEGVGDLDMRFYQPSGTLVQTMDVHFLNRNGQGQLTMIGAGTHVATVTNPSTRPYRYLKILTGLQTARVRLHASGSAGVITDFLTPNCPLRPTG